MLGDLPLISAQHFLDLGNEYWRERGYFAQSTQWGVPADLVRLQRLLHNKGKDEDVVDGEENSLILSSKHGSWTYGNGNKIPYHEDILPRWEGTSMFLFCLAIGSLRLIYGGGFLFIFISKRY